MHSRKRNIATTAAAQIISSEIVGEISQKGTKFKLQKGDSTKGGSLDPSRKGNSAKGTPGWDAQGIGCCTQNPFLNPNPFQQWYGVKNVARVRVNGESCMTLLTMAHK